MRLDYTKDFKIEDGDFVVVESDYDNVDLLLQSNIGHWRQYPDLGFGLQRLINRDFTYKEVNDIQKLLYDDGYVTSVIYQDPNTQEIKVNFT